MGGICSQFLHVSGHRSIPIRGIYGLSTTELAVLSVQVHMRRCRKVWHAARAAVLRTAEQNKKLADRHRTPNPDYQVGQHSNRTRNSTKHVPLRTKSKKLAPRFIGPFTVQALLNPVTVRPSLPRNMRTHNVFHVFQVRPVRTSPLCLAPDPATHPDYQWRSSILHYPHNGC